MYINTNVMSSSLKGTAQYNKSKRISAIDKTAKKNAAVQVMNQKQFIKDQITSLRLVKDKQIANLEKRKNELINTIKDVCGKNKDSLSSLMGISSDLSYILSGDTDYVLEHMDSSTVGRILSGAQMSVGMGNKQLLKDYYSSGSNTKMSFKEYIESNATAADIAKLGNILNADGTINRDKINDPQDKGLFDLLEVIKKEYEQLFKLRDKIEECKKEAESQIQKLNDSLTKMNEKMADKSEENKNFDGNNKRKKKINVIV